MNYYEPKIPETFTFENLSNEQKIHIIFFLNKIRNFILLSNDDMKNIYMFSDYEKMIIISEFNNIIDVFLQINNMK